MPNFRFLWGLSATLVVLSVQATEDGAPPAPYCVHSRDIREVRQSDPRTLAIRMNDERRYRVSLTEACPAATRSDRLQLVSPGGWLCGDGRNEHLNADGRSCKVSDMAVIDTREYAEHALAEHRGRDSGEFETIEVRGKRRRSFGGTTAFCFDTRHLRGWRDDGGDLVVEVSPLRSGGNRLYHAELGSSCSELSTASRLLFVSGVGSNVICGNAGDRVVLARDDPPGEPFLRRRAEIGLIARYGCPISLVYPQSRENRRAAVEE
ncbi:MAG: hypothetical protein E6Q88_06360 [Lysobacteraceae bacterium]|nr:MAG: hypothetical protein E6Q88_06360 [Xanthomonadaceae bacterium]